MTRLGNPTTRPRPTTQQVFSNTLVSPAWQESLERDFFERVALPNGTRKTTSANRLDDLNAAVLPYIAQLPGRPLKIMDVSISSGLTTREWHDFLTENHISFDMVGTDLTVYSSLVSLTSRLAVLVDRDRNILHVDAFGRGAPPRADGVLGIATGMIRMMFGAAMMVDRRLPPLQGRVREAAKGHLLKCEPITLLTRGLSQLESVHVLEEDLLAAERPDFKHAFQVVRAANILNRSYFSEQVLLQIARKLRDRLQPNGLLIVCRTERNGRNNATLFQSSPQSGLRVLLRLGRGSETENLFAAL
jgi:hypothetical protein